MSKCIWCGAPSEQIAGRNVFEGFCDEAPNGFHALAGDLWKLIEGYREALKWYAEPKYYRPAVEGHRSPYCSDRAAEDRGKIARAALADDFVDKKP